MREFTFPHQCVPRTKSDLRCIRMSIPNSASRSTLSPANRLESQSTLVTNSDIKGDKSETDTSMQILIVKHSLGGEYSANGVAEDLERYLRDLGAYSLEVISLPLNSASERVVRTTRYHRGALMSVSERKTFAPPILTTIRHLVFKSRSHGFADVVIGFSAPAVLIAAQYKKTKSLVVSWRIDYVPPRARGRILSFPAKLIEKAALSKTQIHIENSNAAMAERLRSFAKRAVPHTKVVPVAAWREWYSHRPISARARAVAYLGSITERTGAQVLRDIIESRALHQAGIELHIIGGGSMWTELHSMAQHFGPGSVHVYGPVKDEALITDTLSNCRLGIAPYLKHSSGFTEFADPGKLKRYMAAGLPILLSEVPPNAKDIEQRAGGEIISSEKSSEVWTKRILELIDEVSLLEERQQKSLAEAENFAAPEVYARTWTAILEVSQKFR
jgi:glycosyltransferase involved in cell wall biosynthesis